MTKRRHTPQPHRVARPLGFALLVAAALTVNDVQAASDTSRVVPFTPACARQDLRAIAAIEAGADIAGAPAGWLANAGLVFLQARILCRSGHEDEGAALYESFIGFEAAVLNAGKILEQVRR